FFCRSLALAERIDIAELTLAFLIGVPRQSHDLGFFPSQRTVGIVTTDGCLARIGISSQTEPSEWCRMSTEKWESLTRPELQELAQKKGLTGVSRMTKDALIAALAKLAKAKAKVKEKTVAKPRSKPRTRPQLHAASHANG